MLVVIAYDTPSHARRRHLVRLLEDVAERVQWSVFEAWLTASQLEELWDRLQSVIEVTEDRLRLYRVCSYCRDSSRLSGLARQTLVPQFWLA